jgi:hypothetical protein
MVISKLVKLNYYQIINEFSTKILALSAANPPDSCGSDRGIDSATIAAETVNLRFPRVYI